MTLVQLPRCVFGGGVNKLEFRKVKSLNTNLPLQCAQGYWPQVKQGNSLNFKINVLIYTGWFLAPLVL